MRAKALEPSAGFGRSIGSRCRACCRAATNLEHRRSTRSRRRVHSVDVGESVSIKMSCLVPVLVTGGRSDARKTDRYRSAHGFLSVIPVRSDCETMAERCPHLSVRGRGHGKTLPRSSKQVADCARVPLWCPEISGDHQAEPPAQFRQARPCRSWAGPTLLFGRGLSTDYTIWKPTVAPDSDTGASCRRQSPGGVLTTQHLARENCSQETGKVSAT